MKTGKIPWGRLAAEGLLIVGSVYLAIGLEGKSQDRARGREATAALAQLLGELREDRADLDEVRAEQLGLESRYRALLEWFTDPTSMPGDSVQEYLDGISTGNRTMFPRSSAWTTMVASGQLTELDNPALVTRLGNLYENINDRLEYNGRYYDSDLSAFVLGYVTSIWDTQSKQLLTKDPEALASFRNRLRFMHLAWNLYYLDLLDQYQLEVDGLIASVDQHLQARGWDG